MKDATRAIVNGQAAHCFNPRVREGRDTPWALPVLTGECFNPRVREGRDYDFFGQIIDIVVSIHASVKDATSLLHGRHGAVLVSIHASVKDATQRVWLSRPSATFQSTRP